ncbi:MAG: CoA pyrophosphatase [Sphingomicrobium sp.]
MNLFEPIRAALARPPSAPLLTGDIAEAKSDGTPAAVLVAITGRTDPGVILTVRRENLRTHAGQVAFPGGRVDPGEDAVAAALREAWEEIGLEPSLVEVVGTIEPYRTITNYSVTPVVAVIPPDLPLSPHEHEVADWFEAPLAHLIDPANHVRQSVMFDGRQRTYYEIMWGERRIWGATAAMIVNLSRRLRWL